jgi:hypothetical protein
MRMRSFNDIAPRFIVLAPMRNKRSLLSWLLAVIVLTAGSRAWAQIATNTGPDGGSVNAISAQEGASLMNQSFPIVLGGPGGGFYSTDGGLSFHAMSLPLPGINDMAMDKNGTFYLATDDGVWKSTDGGRSWSRAGLAGIDITSIVTHDIFINVTSPNGFASSNDGGATWDGRAAAAAQVLATFPQPIPAPPATAAASTRPSASTIYPLFAGTAANVIGSKLLSSG